MGFAAIVEIPYLLSQMCVFMPISYFLIGFEINAAKFFFYALVFLLSLTTFTLFGQLLVFVTPNVAIAQILGSSRHSIPSFWSREKHLTGGGGGGVSTSFPLGLGLPGEMALRPSEMHRFVQVLCTSQNFRGTSCPACLIY